MTISGSTHLPSPNTISRIEGNVGEPRHAPPQARRQRLHPRAQCSKAVAPVTCIGSTEDGRLAFRVYMKNLQALLEDPI